MSATSSGLQFPVELADALRLDARQTPHVIILDSQVAHGTARAAVSVEATPTAESADRARNGEPRSGRPVVGVAEFFEAWLPNAVLGTFLVIATLIAGSALGEWIARWTP